MKDKMFTSSIAAFFILIFYSCVPVEVGDEKDYFKSGVGNNAGVEVAPEQTASVQTASTQTQPSSHVVKRIKKPKQVATSGSKISYESPKIVVAPVETALFQSTSSNRRFDLSFRLFGNKMYSSGDYMPGGHADFSTDLSVGFKVSGEFYFNDSSSAFMDVMLNKTPLGGNFGSFTATQDSDYLMYLDIGYRYTFNEYISLKGFVGLRQDYVFYAVSTSRVLLTKFLHGLMGLGTDYSFFKSGKFSLDGGTDFSLFLGTTTSRFESKVGLLFGTELRPTFEYSIPFFAFFRFEYFKLNNSLFTNQSGKTILIGVGCTFKFKPAGL